MKATVKKPRARRGRHEGSVFQRGGRWVGEISIGRDANGRRIRKTVYGESKTAVLAELDKLRHDKRAGKVAQRSKVTLAEFLADWLAKLAATGKQSPSTLAGYGTAVKKHVLPRIGGLRMQAIDATTIERLYSDLAADGVGPHATKKCHVVLGLAFKKARKMGIVAANPFQDPGIDGPHAKRPTITVLTANEVARLLAAAVGHRLEAIFHAAIGTGMRQGELLGLQWSSVDLAAGTISVRHSLRELGGSLTLVEPKTAAGKRLIDLPGHAIDALKPTGADKWPLAWAVRHTCSLAAMVSRCGGAISTSRRCGHYSERPGCRQLAFTRYATRMPV